MQHTEDRVSGADPKWSVAGRKWIRGAISIERAVRGLLALSLVNNTLPSRLSVYVS